MVALCIEPYKVQSSLLKVRYPNKTLSPRLHINAKHLCMSLHIHAVINGVLLLVPPYRSSFATWSGCASSTCFLMSKVFLRNT